MAQRVGDTRQVPGAVVAKARHLSHRRRDCHRIVIAVVRACRDVPQHVRRNQHGPPAVIHRSFGLVA